jgi:mRNA (2'-O-methyladenosine-N6-)-methyltransferase
LSTEEAIEKAKTELREPSAPGTFLNCDVRYFNWELFIKEVGKFDVLIIDPPWRIKGAQQNDSQFMFSNCKFSLEYNTMGNSEIARIPLDLISDEGFIFLWILNSQMDTSIEIMQTWGYELVDEITWVKLREGKIYLTQGYYFMHSYEVCLVGYKSNKQAKSKGPE